MRTEGNRASNSEAEAKHAIPGKALSISAVVEALASTKSCSPAAVATMDVDMWVQSLLSHHLLYPIQTLVNRARDPGGNGPKELVGQGFLPAVLRHGKTAGKNACPT